MGTLKADAAALAGAAAGFDGIATELTTAQNNVAAGGMRGSEFGWFATRAGIDTAHDTFISDMQTALEQGSQRQKRIADLLRETARDFGNTDSDVADDYHMPDGTPR